MSDNTQVLKAQYGLVDWYRPLTQTLNSLYQKARKLEVKVLNEKEFLGMIK